MTEYEVASLFFQIVDAAHAALANYLTVIFAVLVVSYFAADQLDNYTWIFLLSVYSLFALGMGNEIFSLYRDLINLGWKMNRMAGGEVLTWHGLATADANGPIWAIPITIAIMCALAYIGSMLFFIRVRKRGSGARQS